MERIVRWRETMVVCAERRHARLTPSERSGAADYVIQRLRDEEHSLQLLTADYIPGPPGLTRTARALQLLVYPSTFREYGCL